MNDEVTDNLETKTPKGLNFWKGLIIPAFFPFVFLICVFLTGDMQIVDYPLLNRFFGGDDLLLYSLNGLLCSLIAWPIIGFNMPSPYHEGGKVSAKIALTVGSLLLFWVLVIFSYIGAS